MHPIIITDMDATSTLLGDIDAFLADSGMAASTFGLRAVSDGKFIARVRSGGGVTLKTVERVRAFMEAERLKLAHPPASTEQPAGEAGGGEGAGSQSETDRQRVDTLKGQPKAA